MSAKTEEIRRLRAENAALRGAISEDRSHRLLMAMKRNMQRDENELRVDRRIREILGENESLRAELMEQARLNGMGSERESRLRAEVQALRREVELLKSMAPGARLDCAKDV